MALDHKDCNSVIWQWSISETGGERKMEQNEFEHAIIISIVKRELEKRIRELIRGHGKELKREEIDTKEFYLFMLNVTGEALEQLKEEA